MPTYGRGQRWRWRPTNPVRQAIERGGSRARFEREARAVASLSHPNICSLFDIGEGYMVMELIDGETLAQRIATDPAPMAVQPLTPA